MDEQTEKPEEKEALVGGVYNFIRSPRQEDDCLVEVKYSSEKYIVFTHNDSGLEECVSVGACAFLPIEQSKPKHTKEEYVKVEFEHAWEAVKAFEEGEVLYTHFQVNRWVTIDNAQQVVPNFQVEKIYRKVVIELSPEEVREQEIEELARDIYHDFEVSEGNENHCDYDLLCDNIEKRAYISAAKTALKKLKG